ncbi:ubiquitin-conjugating enzyme E2 U-like [Haliotis asinina]|uniref:ubiquitin-conjugating enzyme E2 U-like n=1 Tax=Haliotis asinina TaxID=109174 RepID=UPI003531FF13
MYSRAHLLIEKEFDSLKSKGPWGIEVFPLNEDNVFEWVAKIKGLKDTLWEGGIFRLYIKFDENYNIRPPQVCFHTIPFHPNIDMITGRPCIDFLDNFEKWKEGYSITMSLLAIQSLLSNPSLIGAVNMEAVEMLQHSPHTYRQMVQDCVAASQRMEAGVLPQPQSKVDIDAKTMKRETSTRVCTVPPRISKLSFDDYHTTWCGLATSKARDQSKNPLLETIRDKPILQQVHMGLPPEEIQLQVKKQMQEHSALMYGRFGMRPSAEEEKAAKLNRLERMKKIYLPPRVSPTPAPDIVLDSALPALNTKDEPWEKEVDDLVAWTANLDAEAIDTT